MRKVILGIAVLAFAMSAYAQATTGIAWADRNIGVNTRGNATRVDFWVAATDAGIYGQFAYGEAAAPAVRIYMNRFDLFQCDGQRVLIGGHGYVNGTPRLVLFAMEDNFWGPDFFAIAAFHPISGNLLYDRWGTLVGSKGILCDGPGGGE